MKLAVARSITYGVIGAAALTALRLTPPVPHDGRPVSVVAAIDGAADADAPATTVAGFPVAPVVVHAARLSGVDTVALVGTINSSLYAALDKVGEAELPKSQRRSLAWTLADIFQYRVDMSRDLGKGDQFQVLVERSQHPDGKIVINKILGAKLALRGEDVEAVHFKSKESGAEWFDGAGKSLTAAFLRAPVEFRRISSVFGLREHPLFGTWRNHTGTDYAAPMGTPVRAIGDGRVINIGRMGGYGNVIDVRHANGYVSRYGHLSRFARGLHVGSTVGMGSTIGYVGMTGWATGPHLHFEIRVNGVARDPRVALRDKAGAPLSGSEARLFQEIREHTMEALKTETAQAAPVKGKPLANALALRNDDGA